MALNFRMWILLMLVADVALGASPDNKPELGESIHYFIER